MGSNEKCATTALEQFILLSKNTKGAAAIELIKQALETPNVYVFGELLDAPNIKELETTHRNYFDLLRLFAYGVYSDYRENKDSLPPLTPVMEKKLKQLTIVTLASKNKCIHYSTLQADLDIRNVRDLEDLIIEVFYADVVQGKLDQDKQRLEVESALGRDVKPETVTDVISVLTQWCSGCESALSGITAQINKANSSIERHNTIKAQIETEVSNIKKTLKTTSQQQQEEDAMVTESGHSIEDGGGKLARKASKKGLRTSSKFWNKS